MAREVNCPSNEQFSPPDEDGKAKRRQLEPCGRFKSQRLDQQPHLTDICIPEHAGDAHVILCAKNIEAKLAGVSQSIEHAAQKGNWQLCVLLDTEKRALHAELSSILESSAKIAGLPLRPNLFAASTSHASTQPSIAAKQAVLTEAKEPSETKTRPTNHNMSIEAVLCPSSDLPHRLSLPHVRICAIGKISLDASYGKASGKAGPFSGFNGKVGKAHGKTSGKLAGKKGGKQTIMEQVCLHVVDEVSGCKIPVHWKKPMLSTDGLLKALVTITDAKPVVSHNGSVFLELDNASTVRKMLNTTDQAIAVYDLLAGGLWTLAEAGQEAVGSYVDVVLKCVQSSTKHKIDGGSFLQLNLIDKEGTPLNLPVYGYQQSEFTPGRVYLVLGLVVGPGRMQASRGWIDDYSWAQTKFSGWRTAFMDVGSLVVGSRQSNTVPYGN